MSKNLTAGQLLAQDMRESELTVRGLARAMLPVGSTDRAIDNRRRLINKWLNDDDPTQPGNANAERLAEVLKKPNDRYKTPRSYRRQPKPKVAELQEEMAELRRLVEDLREELAHVHRRLDALEDPPRSASA